MSAILQIVKSPYVDEKSSILMKPGKQHSELDDSQMTRY